MPNGDPLVPTAAGHGISGGLRGCLKNPGAAVLARLLVFLCYLTPLTSANAADFNYTSTGGEVTITAYTGAGGAVVVPSMIEGLPVTRIGDFAFYCLNDVTSVEIPSGVVSIGESVFATCRGLKTVTIPPTVKSIGAHAFYYSSLASVNIPEGVLSLGNGLFNDCPALANITIPASVTSMGSEMFYRCTGLTSATILANVESVGGGAFQGCTGLTQVSLPASLTSLSDNLFYGCSKLTTVSIPSGVKSIGSNAFQECVLLSAITIPAGVSSIGSSAFRNCRSLTDLTLLGGVQTIGYGAFSNCLKLTGVNFPVGLVTIESDAFSGCQALASVTLPPGVTQIGSYAFASCTSLAGVTLPLGVTQIGSYAFSSCTSLAGVTIPASVTSIRSYTFMNCSSLAEVTIPASVTSIDSSAFMSCSSLAKVTISAGVASIGSSAFKHCSSLVDVNIPASVTSLDSSAFARCAKISNFTVEEANPNYLSADGVLYDKSMTGLVTYPGARAGSYVIPDGVTSIATDAFSGCVNLTGVTIPYGVTSIKEGAFSYCDLLENVTIPSSVMEIGYGAFSNCGKLSGVVFLGNASNVYWSAFQYAAVGFTVYFQQGATGFTSPLWLGYPATALSANQEIVMKGAAGETLVDGMAAVDFGYLMPGTTRSKSFIISNSGALPLTGISISVDGPAAANFVVSAFSSPVLAPGASATFIVNFSPGTGGAKNAALHVSSDDADESPFDIGIYGICTPTPVPEITVSQPSSGKVFANGVNVLEIGPTEVGTFVSTGVTITNSGTGNMQGMAITLDGVNAADFRFNAAPPAVLAPGASFPCSVSFSPQIVGIRNAKLRIASNDPDENPFDIPLSGICEPPPVPDIAVDPPSGPTLTDGTSIIVFDTLPLGSQSATQSFTIRNEGKRYLQNLAISKAGSNPAEFILSNFFKTTFMPGESATFTVRFSPSTLGDRSAILRIQSNDPDESPFDIQLFGVCSASPVFPEIAIQASDGSPMTDGVSSDSFGPVGTNESLIRNFTITNSGAAALTNLAFAVDGAHAADFEVSGPGSTVILPGTSATCSVTFSPGALGDRTARLQIASNDSDENPFEIDLTGTGTPPNRPEIAVKSSTGAELTDGGAGVSMGSFTLISKISTGFTIRNEGKLNLLNLSVAVGGPDASLVNINSSSKMATVLSPGANTSFAILVYPKKVGNINATLHISSNDADENTFDIPITVTIQPPPADLPVIVVQDPAGKSLKDGKSVFSFGPVKLDSSSTKVFTIRNTGKSNLNLISVSGIEGHRKDFMVTPPAASVVKPGDALRFKVTFTPSVRGNRTISVRIKCDHEYLKTFDIALVGKGVAGASSASALADSAFRNPAALVPAPQVTLTRDAIDGFRYLTLTVIKAPDAAPGIPVIEVSSDLVDWYSGPCHTTVIHDGALILVVRDNTPVRPGAKRHIRISPNQQVESRPLELPEGSFGK